MTHRAPIALCWLIAMLACNVARAQTKVATYDATVLEAVGEFNTGHFAEAYALFERAHTLDPSARTLRGLGLCAYEMRHYVRAVALLERSLADPNKPLSAEQRDEVSFELGKARRFIADVTIEALPPAAHIEFDGVALARPSIATDAGNHVLVVSADGYHTSSTKLLVVGGTTLTVKRHLSPIELTAGSHVDTTDNTGSTPLLTRWWFWTLLGVAVSGTAVAAVALAAAPEPDHGTSGALLRAR